MNAGDRAIAYLYEKLEIDDEWAVEVEGGFRWWPGPLAQTIRIVDIEVSPMQEIGYILSVETEVLTGLTSIDAGRDSCLAEYMCAPSMSGPVFDPAKQTLTSAALTRVHDQNLDWMVQLFLMACALQISEVFLFRGRFAEELSAQPAVSAHPQSGIRDVPDELPATVEALTLQAGKEPVYWTEEMFEAALAEHMQAPELQATRRGMEIDVRFPYGAWTSQCQFVGDDPHPKYGNGLLVAEAYLMPAESEEAGLRMALRFNATNLTRKLDGYGFGSYYYREHCLYFSCFYPNILKFPALIPIAFHATAERAHAMSVMMFGEDGA